MLLGRSCATRTVARIDVRGLSVWMYALVLTLVAAVLRCLDLGLFLTLDEPDNWVGRVQAFARAVAERRWADTDLTGHPGVTTMWLGALGHWASVYLGVPQNGPVGGGTAYLAALRLPLALANSIAVGLGYLALRRLFAPPVALLAALLWATSPVLVAYGQLLHVDGLLTSAMTLSLLYLLVACHPTPRGQNRFDWTALVVAGVCAGLALLTKSPALALPPLAALLLLGVAPWKQPSLRWRGALTALSVWAATAGLVVVLGWPAWWGAPRAALASVMNEVLVNGGQPHLHGAFFLGQRVADPGWLFYPAVLLWRITPPTLVGLLALPLALRARPEQRMQLLALCGFVLLVGGALSLLPKKLDRYLLPVFPAIEILAAVGLWQLAMLLRQHSQKLVWSAMLGLLLVQFGIVAWYRPYYLSYYNPLLGGGPVAERTLLVGQGEGLDQVAAWLQSRPDLARGPLLARNPALLAPLLPVPVYDLAERHLNRQPNYAVLYVRGVQRGDTPVPEAYARQTPPLYRLQMYGITYASVHQLPRPFTTSVGASFGQVVQLRGFSQTQLDNTLVISPSWNVVADRPSSLWLFVHVLDGADQRVAQLDLPLDEGLFGEWQAGQQFGGAIRLPLPSLAPGQQYRVLLGVYDPATGARLPVQGATTVPEALDGPHVIELLTLRGR